jgi:hypothetical protein
VQIQFAVLIGRLLPRPSRHPKCSNNTWFGMSTLITKSFETLLLIEVEQVLVLERQIGSFSGEWNGCHVQKIKA